MDGEMRRGSDMGDNEGRADGIAEDAKREIDVSVTRRACIVVQDAIGDEEITVLKEYGMERLVHISEKLCENGPRTFLLLMRQSFQRISASSETWNRSA